MHVADHLEPREEPEGRPRPILGKKGCCLEMQLVQTVQAGERIDKAGAPAGPDKTRDIQAELGQMDEPRQPGPEFRGPWP